MKITVSTWHDTVSPKSAEHGDYESTGNDYREFVCRSVDDAIDYLEDFLRSYRLDRVDTRSIGGILYDDDGSPDYSTGDIDYQRISFDIEGTDEQQRRYTKLINRFIA